MKYSIIVTLQLLTAWAVCKENNCTVLPCQTDLARLNRRQWPQLDFDFYHDRNNPPKSTETPPEYSSNQSSYLSSPPPTSSEMKNTSNDRHDDNHNITMNNNKTNCQIDPIESETVKRLDWIRESYLLRSVFQEQEANKKIKWPNIDEHFRQKLLRVYRMAADKQSDALQNSDKNNKTKPEYDNLRRRQRRHSPEMNITVWDVQVSKTQPEIDVVYLLSRDNVPVPFEDAVKLLTFVDRDVIRNATGYKVLHKVLRYDRNRNEVNSIVSSSITWKWLLIVCALLLTTLILITLWIGCTKYNRDPIGSLHNEISRLSRSNRDSRHSARLRDSSHQNLGLEASDSETDGPPPLPRVPPPPSLHRTDVGSQASLEPIYSKPSLLAPISRNFSSLSGRTGSYPVNPNPDYDRISYIKTRETIEEKRRPQNIVEVQMSKETQSIVKEIRNELNRYNMKKILDDAPVGTSEA